MVLIDIVRPQASFKGAAFTGVLWSLAQAWGVRLITLIHFVVVARLLEPSDLGIIALATALVACMSTLVDQGMTTIVESRATHDAELLDTAWWATFIASLLIAALITAASPWISRWTGRSYLGALLPVMSVSVVLTAISAIQLSLLKARFLNRTIALALLIGSVVGAVTGISCALAGLAYWSLVIKALVEGAFTSTLLIWQSPWRPGFAFRAKVWRGLLRAGAPVVGMRIIDIVNQRLDSLVIGARLGATALGFYSTGQRIYQIAMEAMFSAVNQVSLPVFGRVSQEPGRSAELLLRLVGCVSLVTFPVFALLAATGPDLIAIIFGEKWRASGPVLSVFAVGGMLFSVSYFNAPLMIANGHARSVFWLSLINGVTNGIGFFVAVPFGAVAVAAAYVLRGYIVYPINLLMLREICGLSFRRYAHALAAGTVSSLGAALSASVCVLALSSSNLLLRVGCAWLVGVTAYLFVLVLAYPRDAHAAVLELKGMVGAARGLRRTGNEERS